MYIERHIQKTIHERMDAYPAVLLTGPRQVGKSTLLQNAYPDVEYILLDDPILLAAMKNDALGFLKLRNTPLILDEIQRAGESFVSIKYMIDTGRRPGMYLLTGSQKYELMEKNSESLAGRISVISMLGLSTREIMGDPFDTPFLPSGDFFAQRNSKPMTQSELWERIHRGSMPELYANDLMKWENYYADYTITYVERDVRQLAQVGDTLAFTAFMTALAARTGELLNMAALARDTGISIPTAKKWLSILEASGIIYLLKPFSTNINKRIVKTPKVYFTDTGLICYLCRWLTPDALIHGAQAGGIFETYVVSEIVKSWYNAGKIPELFFFRNSDGQEVDLIFYQNGTLYPMEIKKTASPNQKDIKHFKVLQTFFPHLTIGEGGVICNYDMVLPLEGIHRIIPVSML